MLIIRGGTIVTASETFNGDIVIENGKISAITNSQEYNSSAEVIDASGRLILPGGVDVHTHFDLPMFNTVSSDDHYTGHKAAAFGGTTTVIDFIPQDSPDLLENVDQWHKKVSPKAAIDYGFHMNITNFHKKITNQIPTLVEEGITSLKVFTAYNDRLRLSDGNIFKTMRTAGEHGLLTMMHAENGDIIEVLVAEALAAGHTSPEWHALTRPAWGAVEAVARGVSFSAQTGSPLYIVHMNAGGEADQLQYGRDLGLPVMGETCPQYLFFSIENLKREDGAKWICSPPMRTEDDQQRLWLALQEGTIQTIGTDHCPFFYNGNEPIEYEGELIAIPGKELGKNDFTKIPNGLPAVGDRLPVMWTEGVVKGRLTPNQVVALTATNPAKIFGMYPQKGTIMPGSDADLIIWDPQKQIDYGVKWSQHRTDYNLYEGWRLTGFPEKVLLRGKIIVDQQEWKGNRGMGNFIHRKPFADIL